MKYFDNNKCYIIEPVHVLSGFSSGSLQVPCRFSYTDTESFINSVSTVHRRDIKPFTQQQGKHCMAWLQSNTLLYINIRQTVE